MSARMASHPDMHTIGNWQAAKHRSEAASARRGEAVDSEPARARGEPCRAKRNKPYEHSTLMHPLPRYVDSRSCGLDG